MLRVDINTDDLDKNEKVSTILQTHSETTLGRINFDAVQSKMVSSVIEKMKWGT